MVGFEKALGAVKVIKDQIQYRSQSLLNLAVTTLGHIQIQSFCWKPLWKPWFVSEKMWLMYITTVV